VKTREIEISGVGLSQILQTIGRLDMPLMGAERGGAKAYLRAVREWERLGFGEPDFDGGFRPEPLFARLVYSLRGSGSALRYQSGGDTLIFLRGVVDLIRLRGDAGQTAWRMSFQPMGALRDMCLTELVSAREGMLWVQSDGEAAGETNLADTEPGSPERIAALGERLAQFYPKHPTEGGESA